MFFKLLMGWVNTNGKLAAKGPRKAKLGLESLEGRLVPAASVIAPQWFQQAKVPAMTAAVSNLPRSQWIVELKEAHTNTLKTVDDAAKYFKTPAARLDVIRGLGEKGVFLVRGFGNPNAVKNAIQRLPGVQSVTQNTMIQAKTLSADPRFQELWGLDNQGQVINGVAGVPDADIDFPEAVARATIQTQIVVGVVDTGIDYNHPDLKDSMWVNPGEIAGNNRDDDGNGFVDDVYGYDFINNDSDPMDDFGIEDTYHGTHVAGTIAATMNNTLGVAGIASGAAKLMALKIFNKDGYTSTLSIVTAMNYSAMMRDRGTDIRVLNNSWGGGSYDPLEAGAIKNVSDAGIMFVAAAGNDFNDNDENPFYPANFGFSGIVSVAASDNRDQLADFSNYGATTVHLAAPGVGILSTQQGARYQYMSGTSMAAPHVSGALALAWAAHPEVSMTELRDKLFQSVDQVASLAGKVSTGGRLNVNNLLMALDDGSEQPVPAAPGNLRTAGVGDSWVNLLWNDNSDNEQGFEIEVSLDGGSNWEFVDIVGPGSASITISELEPGTSYQFRVLAFNDIGYSDPSNVVTVLTTSPMVIPSAPSNVRPDNVWSRKVDLAWNDNSDNETGFRIMVSADGGASWSEAGTAGPDATRFRAEGLDPERSYTFGVQAIGGGGASALVRSRAFVTAPPAPTGLRPENTWARTIDLAWNDVSRTETGFRVYVSTTGGASWTMLGTAAANSQRFRVTDLSPSTSYQFAVRAAGAEGLSEYSNIATIVTRGDVLAAPSNVRADNVWSDKVDVAWNDNSRNETGFNVYYSTNGGVSWVFAGAAAANATRFRVQGLTAGGRYVFGVQAVNGDETTGVVVSAPVTTPVPTSDFTRMSVSSVGRTSFRLNWNYNRSTPDHFEVYIEARGSWRLSENVPRDRSSALIEFEQRNGSRLKAGETYRVRIRAVDSAGRATSDWSETLTVRMDR